MKGVIIKSITLFILSTSLIFFCSCNKSTDPEILPLDSAKEKIFTDALNNNDSGKVVYKLPQIVNMGDIISCKGLSSKDFTIPSDSWFFFIDDMPNYYWIHDCRYVFVDIKTKKLIIYEWKYYPTCLDEMEIVEF